jgi:lambda repressor-like predicted transcriptional regulator
VTTNEEPQKTRLVLSRASAVLHSRGLSAKQIALEARISRTALSAQLTGRFRVSNAVLASILDLAGLEAAIEVKAAADEAWRQRHGGVAP